jgi:hypothetical protein
MRYIVAAVLSVAATIGGTVYSVHTYDTRQASTQTVRDYDDGFTDGVCAGSVTVAVRDYRFNCSK